MVAHPGRPQEAVEGENCRACCPEASEEGENWRAGGPVTPIGESNTEGNAGPSRMRGSALIIREEEDPGYAPDWG